MNLVSRIIGHGTYENGVNKGKPFIRVSIGGKGQTLPVTEKVRDSAIAVGYIFLKKIGLNEPYPTTNDSTSLDENGNPIYSKGDKLTVAQYWAKRNQAEMAKAKNEKREAVAIEARELFNFNGIPTPEEAKILAGEAVRQMQFA